MERILQIIGGMNRRGAETFIMNVYRKIDKSKFQFDFLVYSATKQDYEDEIVALGGRVIHISCHNGAKAFLSIRQFKKVFKEYGPYKVVHIQTLLNSAWPLLALPHHTDVLRVVHSHNTQNKPVMGFIDGLYENFSKFIIRNRTDVMVACGTEAGEYLFGEKFHHGGIVLNNGIDLDVHAIRDDVSVEKIRQIFNLHGKLVIGNVARFDKVKNHTFMIKIAKALKSHGIDFRMLFVGNGNGEASMRMLVRNEGLENEVIFTGLRSDIRDIMFTLDVFLMPSYFEGNPVTLVEAQAAGLPCVISDVITDKMDMGLGLITKCSLQDSHEKWAEAIIKASKCRCYDVQKVRKQFAICGYDAQSTADKLTSIYMR